MSDGGSSGLAGAGWYPDPWTPSRRRYWTGSSWTFATTDKAQIDDPPPSEVSPLPEGHGLPAPVARRPAGATVEASSGSPAPARQKPVKWMLAVVVGLLVGVAGVALSNRSPSNPDSETAPRAAEPTPTTNPSPNAPSANNDPSATALGSLIVKSGDVPSTVTVALFPGGIGLGQPTLDLCNGTFPSESRRTARVQNAVVDGQGNVLLSTEAVLYGDSGGTTQAFSELQAVVTACPSAPVQSPVGQPTVITRFSPPPDSSWPQTPSVNRLAFDLTTDDGAGRTRRSIAVYLQRGRALLGVYFSQPDGRLPEVEGQTTIDGIVGVFAARLAALPTSVVGA